MMNKLKEIWELVKRPFVGKDRFLKRIDYYIIKKFLGTYVFAIALILSIIGSLNWGLVSLFQFDLVAWLFGGQDALFSRLIFTLVGIAGLWCIALLFDDRQGM